MVLTIRRFNKFFNYDEQYIRLFDLANDCEVCFEGQIKEMPTKFKVRRIIMFDTMFEDDYDGYFGIYIAMKDEDEYYNQYNEDEDYDEDEDE